MTLLICVSLNFRKEDVRNMQEVHDMVKRENNFISENTTAFKQFKRTPMNDENLEIVRNNLLYC